MAKALAITTVDQMIAQFGDPGLSLAWGLARGMNQAAIELRTERAIEFVEGIMDNPDQFTKSMLRSSAFQDGFAYVFPKYLLQKSETKRNLIRNILAGYGTASEPENYELERFLHILEIISPKDAEALGKLYDGTIEDWYRKQFPEMDQSEIISRANEFHNASQLGNLILAQHAGLSRYMDDIESLELLSRLSSLGLLTGGIEAQYGGSFSSFKRSSLGRSFVFYASL